MVGFWLWSGGGRCNPEGSGGPGGQPPVPAAEQRDQGRYQQRSDDGGVQQDARAQSGGEHLEADVWAACQRREGQEQDQRGAGDQPSGATTTAIVEGLGRWRGCPIGSSRGRPATPAPARRRSR